MKTDVDPLHDALAELATTMSPNPDRLRQVRQRVARRRRRRMAAGAAVSAGAVAAAVGIAMVPREPRPSLQFNIAGASLPECASIGAPAFHVPTTTAPVKPAAPDVPHANSTPAADPDIVGGYKGYGVVIANDVGAVTIANFEEPGIFPMIDRIDVIVDSASVFENRGQRADLSHVVIGRRVAFSVTVRTGDRKHLDYLDVDATDVRSPARVDDLAPDGALLGKGVVEEFPAADQMVVQGAVGHGDSQSLRIALVSDTHYFRYETACANGVPAVGSSILFSVVANADGTYTATELRTYD